MTHCIRRKRYRCMIYRRMRYRRMTNCRMSLQVLLFAFGEAHTGGVEDPLIAVLGIRRDAPTPLVSRGMGWVSKLVVC